MTRDALVRAFRDQQALLHPSRSSALTPPQRQREDARKEQLLVQYGDALPALPVSRCPLCGAVLHLAFDAGGLDGMWWERSGIVKQRRPDESHFRLLLGALDLHGREPLESAANREVLPGPGAPFVVKRLLDMDGMAAVVSSVDMPHGDTAYLVAYFRLDPVNPFHLHQPWAREHLIVDPEDDPKGRGGGWGLATDPWDFELQPWIDQGKLKWIAPGDAGLTLQDSGPCPYVNLPGIKAPQQLRMGKVATLPLPNGKPFDPFD